jgi:RNA-directed DNA polymerase
MFEAKFESNRYGFRPVHSASAKEAMALIFNNLRSTEKWILDADIKGCFDNISHEKLLSLMDDTNPSDKRIINQWLKAGVMDKLNLIPKVGYVEKGTPQGGIISPLLANIALDGMLFYLFEKLKREYKYHNTRRFINGSAISVIRYADDFVVIHKDKEVIERAKEILENG